MDQVKFFKGCLPQILLAPFFNIFVLFDKTMYRNVINPFQVNITIYLTFVLAILAKRDFRTV